MGCRFQLEIAPLRLGREVGVERAVDIDRARVVPFDQVAVVAVHAAHEAADGSGRDGRQAAHQAADGSSMPGRAPARLAASCPSVKAKSRSPLQAGWPSGGSKVGGWSGISHGMMADLIDEVFRNSPRKAKNTFPIRRNSNTTVGMIRRGFLDAESRKDLTELAQDGFAAVVSPSTPMR